MNKRLTECLEDRVPGEYILPFFWQHGESHETLKREIDAIEASGITEFCVESRTHQDFGRDKWWDDMTFMLEEAKKRNMRLWLLDDKHFPTGYANLYNKDHPHLRPLSLRYEFRDFAGPVDDASLIPPTLKQEERLISVVAYQRTHGERILEGEGQDLLPLLSDGLIAWDIPQGFWRVFYIIEGHSSFLPGTEYYINLLDPESCKAMLYAVYQPHYEHFKSYFGTTFAGFFSDEPQFLIERQYHATMGREGSALPWSRGFETVVAREAGLSVKETLLCLPLFWQDHDRAPLFRESFMEAATKAFRDNFSYLLGNWCREHGVEYIGHIIEDSNTHQRLGYGPGHYFRALEGQTMAGIDIVLHQMLPGFLELPHSSSCSDPFLEPSFFLDTLPKLGASLAHIQPLKKGRAMCEIFGAFGWAEGLWEMKYMTDLMLCGGINHFVPHAFSPKYPDSDCPPHFYADGHNSQFAHFKCLMDYMKRGSHLLSGGIHRSGVGVFYNAEAEWATGKHMVISDICPLLAREQVDFDILPADVLAQATISNQKMIINREEYSLLIVPYSELLPVSVIQTLDRLSREGLTVWFVDGKPAPLPGQQMEDALQNTHVIAKEGLGKAAALQFASVKTGKPHTDLRVLHMEYETAHCYMLRNTSIFSEIDDRITFPSSGSALFYDAWNNACYAPNQTGSNLRVRLAPGESIFVIFTEHSRFPAYDYRDQEAFYPNLKWDISVKACGEQSYTALQGHNLRNLSRELPDFNGIIRYQTTLSLEEGQVFTSIDFGALSESCEVYLNGEGLGVRVTPPYRYTLPLHAGSNTLTVLVTANMGYSQRDNFSSYLPLRPMGLTGKVSLY